MPLKPSIDQLLFVLGMHRSGTSALAGALVRGGFAVPGEVLPGNADNPDGYYESRPLVDIDNQILRRLGSSWHDEGPLSALARDSANSKACGELLDEWSFGGEAGGRHRYLVAKDPRLCRLLVMWRKAASERHIPCSALLISRPLPEVQRSLQRRAANPAFRPASMLDPDRVALLWLRSLVAAEAQSRGMRRACLSYRQLVSAPEATLESCLATLSLPGNFEFDTRAAKEGLRMGRPPATIEQTPEAAAPEIRSLCQMLHEIVDGASGRDLEDSEHNVFDSARTALEIVDQRYRSLHTPAAEAPDTTTFSRSIAIAVADQELCQRSTPAQLGPVLFVSDDDSTRGYRYRVSNRVAALKEIGVRAWLANAEERSWSPEVEEAALVIVHRALESPGLERLYQRCRELRIPIGYDIDDLLFEPSLMTPGHFAYLERPEVEVADWQARAQCHQRLLQRSDFGLFSTQALADAAAPLVAPALVVANGLSRERLAHAQALLQDSASAAAPGLPEALRIGYASGTPTHQRDFALVVAPLARALASHDRARLVIVGHLDLEPFAELLPFRERIELRPIVPFDQLPDELARFDINLAPLEPGNPLTEAKSELKYFEAGLLAVPTIASDTAPMKAAIRDGDTGFLAASAEQWQDVLEQLLDDRELRLRVGRQARLHAIACFGPDAQASRFLATLIRIQHSPDAH